MSMGYLVMLIITITTEISAGVAMNIVPILVSVDLRSSYWSPNTNNTNPTTNRTQLDVTKA